ncbi:MAG: molybdenum ABC transporter ATP-binding protein [Acidobacteriota bacterium]|nr:MAG: molybdenum ABC transporter ATP-binding protein [Acidobacteriota bacterium]
MIEARFNITKGDFEMAVNVGIPSKGVTALFGPSGSGKTTFLRTVAGLEKHAGCSLSIDGEVWQEGSTFVPPYKRPLGYVFQEPSLFPHLTVRANIEYGRNRSARAGISVDEAIKFLDIGGLLARRPSQLSGGEQQRVAIARALAVDPRILLMDEPLSSLDEELKGDILPYLDRLHEELKIPVIYVSHSADEVARVADSLVLLEKGSVKAEGPLAEVLTRLDLAPAHRDDAEAVIDAVAAGYDEEFGLALLDFSGGRFSVPGPPIETGKPVRLRLAARDVSLTLEKQTDTSILNIFPAIVAGIADSGPYQTTVLLDISGVPVLARVTKRSAATLRLEQGKSVFAQAKSVAVIS